MNCFGGRSGKVVDCELNIGEETLRIGFFGCSLYYVSSRILNTLHVSHMHLRSYSSNAIGYYSPATQYKSGNISKQVPYIAILNLLRHFRLE